MHISSVFKTAYIVLLLKIVVVHVPFLRPFQDLFIPSVQSDAFDPIPDICQRSLTSVEYLEQNNRPQPSLTAVKNEPWGCRWYDQLRVDFFVKFTFGPIFYLQLLDSKVHTLSYSWDLWRYNGSRWGSREAAQVQTLVNGYTLHSAVLLWSRSFIWNNYEI